MRSIFKKILVTPGNYLRIAARIVPQGQREAIRPSIRISHYAFTNQHDQSGYIIISHTTRRAGICVAEERTEWGKWNEETGIITTDSGQQYTRLGEKMQDALDQFSAQESVVR